jgi:hypothetical protein
MQIAYWALPGKNNGNYLAAGDPHWLCVLKAACWSIYIVRLLQRIRSELDVQWENSCLYFVFHFVRATGLDVAALLCRVVIFFARLRLRAILQLW